MSEIQKGFRTQTPEEQRPRWEAYLEQGGLGLVALASVAIGLLDFFKLLDNTVLAGRTTSMTLVVAGLIAGYLVVERRGISERLNKSVRSLDATLGRVENNLSAFFEGFEGDRFSELKLLYGLRSYGAAVTKDEIKGGADQAFGLWGDALRDATSFFAFNYVSATEVWGTGGWAFNSAHAAQLARLRLGCSIKRVFVIDDADEYEVLKALMLAQAGAGMEVKWLFKYEIAREPLVVAYTQELGTWDFVVVDTDLVLRVALDENRRMKGCSLARDRELHQKALHVFREGLQLGHDPGETPAGLKKVGRHGL
jgi:hypothetical protein